MFLLPLSTSFSISLSCSLLLFSSLLFLFNLFPYLSFFSPFIYLSISLSYIVRLALLFFSTSSYSFVILSSLLPTPSLLLFLFFSLSCPVLLFLSSLDLSFLSFSFLILSLSLQCLLVFPSSIFSLSCSSFFSSLHLSLLQHVNWSLPHYFLLSLVLHFSFPHPNTNHCLSSSHAIPFLFARSAYPLDLFNLLPFLSMATYFFRISSSFLSYFFSFSYPDANRYFFPSR